jgi:hypothetical protein
LPGVLALPVPTAPAAPENAAGGAAAAQSLLAPALTSPRAPTVAPATGIKTLVPAGAVPQAARASAHLGGDAFSQTQAPLDDGSALAGVAHAAHPAPTLP